MKRFLVFAFLILATAKGYPQQRYLKNGKVNFALSSHQDMAWMDIPENCTEFRIEKILMPTIRLLEKDPLYCFTMEYALTLEEFLKKYPELKPEIHRLTQGKRLDWGATFNQPYESLLSGEALVRQTYLGKRWLQKQLPGCEFVTAFNPDVPGRALQTSQIHSKAGIKYNVITRFEPGIYRWYSPDGSSVLCKSNGIYCEYARALAHKKEEVDKKDYIRSIVDVWDPYYKKHKVRPNLFFLHTDDNEKPYDYRTIFKELSAEKNMPQFEYATVSTAMDHLTDKKTVASELMGEWPNLWLYIHNPTHHEAITAMRNAQRTLVNVEKFATIHGLLSKSFADYPQARLDAAWKQAIYPDHGWGGNGGNHTDSLFKSQLQQSEKDANILLDQALIGISSLLDHQQEGRPIIVFNPHGWLNSSIVKADLNLYGITNGDLKLYDEKGNEIEFQYLSKIGKTKDGDVKIAFKADSVPPVGYKSFYMRQVKEKKAPVLMARDIDIETDAYMIKFAPGGIKGIWDKRLDRELLQTDKFLGGEVFCTRSEGTGAGEFAEIQPIGMEGFEKSSDYAPQWNIVESGKVREVRETKTRFRHATVTQRVIAYHASPEIEIEIDIEGFTGEEYREFRMTMPLNQKNPSISYEVPMGVVEIGKNDLSISAGKAGGLHYTQPLNKTPLRECQDWFASTDANATVMLSSSVGVFGYKDATANPVDYPVLQPVLLASRRSCNGLGNWYLQQGNHSYRFSLSSASGGWQQLHREGAQGNQPLIAVSGKTMSTNPSQPTSQSFFSVDVPNVVISTIKKHEDGDGVVIRLVDMEGKDSTPVFSSFKPVESVDYTNIIEEPIKRLPCIGVKLPFQVGHHAIETYLLRFDPSVF